MSEYKKTNKPAHMPGIFFIPIIQVQFLDFANKQRSLHNIQIPWNSNFQMESQLWHSHGFSLSHITYLTALRHTQNGIWVYFGCIKEFLSYPCSDSPYVTLACFYRSSCACIDIADTSSCGIITGLISTPVTIIHQLKDSFEITDLILL